MTIQLTTNYNQVEENCITPLDITLIDPAIDQRCRYFLILSFGRSKDKGGDIVSKKFYVVPGIPHRFWVQPESKGALTIFAYKECPESINPVQLYSDFPPTAYGSDPKKLERLIALIDSLSSTGFIITDNWNLSLPIVSCSDFDAKSAATGVGVGAGVGAGAIAAALIIAAESTALGAAGAITLLGVGLALGVGVVVLVVIGAVVYWFLKKDCCELGVQATDKGTQGMPVGP